MPPQREPLAWVKERGRGCRPCAGGAGGALVPHGSRRYGHQADACLAAGVKESGTAGKPVSLMRRAFLIFSAVITAMQKGVLPVFSALRGKAGRRHKQFILQFI